jgi:hypothetical protein
MTSNDRLVGFGFLRESHLVDLGLLQDTHSEATRFEVFPNTKFVLCTKIGIRNAPLEIRSGQSLMLWRRSKLPGLV